MTYLLEEKINTNLDSFTNFIRDYLENNFNSPIKEVEVIFHLKSKARKKEFKKILELEKLWVLQLKDIKLEENHNDINGDFKKYFERFRLHQQQWILHEFTKKPNIIGRIKNKLKIPVKISAIDIGKFWETKLIKLDSFCSQSIYRNWDKFNSKVPKYTVLVWKMRVIPSRFFSTLFTLIYKEKKDSQIKEVKNLYENILSETEWKTNHEWQINIFYNFEDYIDKKSSIYPILFDLEQKSLLEISHIAIKDWFLHFSLKNLNNLAYDKFEEAYNISKRMIIDYAIFENGDLYINSEKIDFRKKETSKTYNLLKLFFELQQNTKKQKIKFEELDELYKRKKQKWLWKSKFRYEDLRKTIEDFNDRKDVQKHLSDFIVPNVEWLLCKYTRFQK